VERGSGWRDDGHTADVKLVGGFISDSSVYPAPCLCNALTRSHSPGIAVLCLLCDRSRREGDQDILQALWI
jgi:hypothetical protein